MSDVTDAPRLYFDKLSVAKYNFEKLKKHGSPVARISALYSGRNAKNATADDASGLGYAYMQPSAIHIFLVNIIQPSKGDFASSRDYVLCNILYISIYFSINIIMYHLYILHH